MKGGEREGRKELWNFEASLRNPAGSKSAVL